MTEIPCSKHCLWWKPIFVMVDIDFQGRANIHCPKQKTSMMKRKFHKKTEFQHNITPPKITIELRGLKNKEKTSHNYVRWRNDSGQLLSELLGGEKEMKKKHSKIRLPSFPSSPSLSSVSWVSSPSGSNETNIHPTKNGFKKMPWLHGWKGPYKFARIHTRKGMKLWVCLYSFSFGKQNFITDLSQDANKNRIMMMMMMCCDWHCSQSYLATKNSIFAVMFDVEHFLNHNIFWGGSKLFLATESLGLGFKQRKIQTKKWLILQQFPTHVCTQVKHVNKTSDIVIVHVPHTPTAWTFFYLIFGWSWRKKSTSQMTCWHPHYIYTMFACWLGLQFQVADNMSPEKGPFQKENGLPTMVFHGIC